MEEMCEAKTASSVISWTVDMVVVVVVGGEFYAMHRNRRGYLMGAVVGLLK